MLGLERERLLEIALEVVFALTGDAVEDVQREVVESGLAKEPERAPHVVGAGAALENVEKVRPEALRAERDTGDSTLPQSPGKLGRHRFRVRLHRDLVGGGERVEQSRERLGVGERRRPTADEDRLQRLRKHLAPELELAEKRVDVGPVLATSARHRDEVAVPAAVAAERQVQVQVANAHQRFLSSPRLSTARKASCGTSTPPTCFMRFFPFFCFSRSLRLRVMSPP